MSDLVSIVMPSYNTGRFIKETIESVLLQTYINWELIIVDDCSTDNTDEVVNSFQDDRIIYVKNSNNAGAAVSRNKALQLAKGQWIAFLDSDDIWYPQKLEKQLKFMKDNGYDFTYTMYEEIDENSQKNGKVISGPKKLTRLGMLMYCWPGCLTVMYNHEKIGYIQICDIKKNNDYAMWLQVIKKANCYKLNEVLAKYRRRTGSISNQKYLTLVKWHYRLFKQAGGYNVFVSVLLTGFNLFFGVLKKIVYVKQK